MNAEYIVYVQIPSLSRNRPSYETRTTKRKLPPGQKCKPEPCTARGDLAPSSSLSAAAASATSAFSRACTICMQLLLGHSCPSFLEAYELILFMGHCSPSFPMAAAPQRPAAGHGSTRRRGLRALVVRQRLLQLPQRRLGRRGLHLLLTLQRLLQPPLRHLGLRVLIARQRLLQLP